MTPDGLAWSLLRVGGILLLVSILGRAVVPAFIPGGRAFRLERWGWSIALAGMLLVSSVLGSFAVGIRPGWIAIAVVAGGGIVLARRFRLPGGDPPAAVQGAGSPAGHGAGSPVVWALGVVTAAGMAIYVVRSLAEPMWSNDFLAVWGLKGKTIFAAARIPQPLFRWPELEFSNPGYPIGLPLVYAGIAFLLHRWDDHALALLFPLVQLGTLLVLIGWLRRRGSAAVVALAAAAFVANFGPLYSAWLAGMAEVPAAFTFLLLGCAAWDVLDHTDPGCVRRLGLASLAAAATKNEGVFLLGTVVAFLLVRAARRRERRLWAGVVVALAAGLFSVGLHRWALGSHAVRGLDPSLLWLGGLGSRAAEALREEWIQLVRPVWAGLVAVFALVVLAPRRAWANPILILVAASLATYLALPVMCPFGPGWLVHWTIGRIAWALVPLLAAGIGMAWTVREEAAPRPPVIETLAR